MSLSCDIYSAIKALIAWINKFKSIFSATLALSQNETFMFAQAILFSLEMRLNLTIYRFLEIDESISNWLNSFYRFFTVS